MPHKAFFSKRYTLFFISVCCVVAAALLSITSLSLEKRKNFAKEIDQKKELLITANILTHKGFLLMPDDPLKNLARFDTEKNRLIPSKTPVTPTLETIELIYQNYLFPFFVDANGNRITLIEAGFEKNVSPSILQSTTIKNIRPVYALQIPQEEKPFGYIFPVKGFGLWDAIYGYIAIKNDGVTVIGTTWYEQAETAGLGADIATALWQKQFEGKKIFRPNPDGSINPNSSYIGITVVKGKVSDIYGNKPAASNAVDGVTGASQTMRGVTEAYHDSLSFYRPFLTNLYETK
jgi:Na+-transporting NADH:ubiquinone oxidoreductase subunit C